MLRFGYFHLWSSLLLLFVAGGAGRVIAATSCRNCSSVNPAKFTEFGLRASADPTAPDILLGRRVVGDKDLGLGLSGVTGLAGQDIDSSSMSLSSDTVISFSVRSISSASFRSWYSESVL